MSDSQNDKNDKTAMPQTSEEEEEDYDSEEEKSSSSDENDELEAIVKAVPMSRGKQKQAAKKRVTPKRRVIESDSDCDSDSDQS